MDLKKIDLESYVLCKSIWRRLKWGTPLLKVFICHFHSFISTFSKNFLYSFSSFPFMINETNSSKKNIHIHKKRFLCRKSHTIQQMRLEMNQHLLLAVHSDFFRTFFFLFFSRKNYSKRTLAKFWRKLFFFYCYYFFLSHRPGHPSNIIQTPISI